MFEIGLNGLPSGAAPLRAPAARLRGAFFRKRCAAGALSNAFAVHLAHAFAAPRPGASPVRGGGGRGGAGCALFWEARYAAAPQAAV